MATTKVGLSHDPRKARPWVVRWFGEYDPATDKQRRYSKAFRLKRDAERFRAEKHAEFDKGAQRDRPAQITLGEFCRKYMARRKHEWREKTRRDVQGVCDRLNGHFGRDVPLSSITRDRATAFWAAARKVQTACEGEELSVFSRNGLLRYAKTMFRYAVEWGDLASHPFAGIKAIRVGKRGRRKWHYVRPEEYMALLRVAPDLRWKVFYALAYTSAARFGELFSLTDAEIDLGRGRLLIRSREGTEDLPPFQVKDHEDREIPLPRHVVKLVAGWVKLRPTESPFILLTPERYQRVLARWQRYRASGEAWLNIYMVNNVVREIRRHAKWAGLKLDGTLTMHCFRKSCGQNWANHLPMNVVKELMGHADIGTTAEFYSTVTEDHEANAQWVIEAITVGSQGKTDARLTPRPKFDRNRRVG